MINQNQQEMEQWELKHLLWDVQDELLNTAKKLETYAEKAGDQEIGIEIEKLYGLAGWLIVRHNCRVGDQQSEE